MTSIKIFLRKNRAKNGLFPVVMRITKDRKSKLITLGKWCRIQDWNDKESCFKKSFPEYNKSNRVLLKMKQRALDIIDDFSIEAADYTLSEFESRFRLRRSSPISVKEFWLEKISDLITAGRTGNARAYKDTMKSFFKFEENDQIRFSEINFEKLDKYETFLRSTGSSDSGIAFRMRELRALYNDAIKKGVALEVKYPFKLYKVSKLRGHGAKRALSREEIEKFKSLDELKYPELVKSKMLFMFSYYTCGMNYYDMMKIKWTNIQNDRIEYTRSKTKKRFSIKILDPVKEILSHFKESSHNEYIFPILLRHDMTPVQIEHRKAKTIKKFNSDLKKIALVVGIKCNISSYVARHSYATNMRERGISTDIISQSMGHEDVSITTAYLKEFDLGLIDEAIEKLLNEPLVEYIGVTC